MRRRLAVRFAIVAGTLIRWRVHRMLPGLAGAALVSLGAGTLLGRLLGPGLALWAILALSGGFLLWIGAAMNQAPRPPRGSQQPGE